VRSKKLVDLRPFSPLLARDFGPGASPVRYPEADVVALDKAFEKYKIAMSPIQRLHRNVLGGGFGLERLGRLPGVERYPE